MPRFNKPWGLTTEGNTLYIADSTNIVFRGMSIPKDVTKVSLNVRKREKLTAKGKVTPPQVGGEISVKLFKKQGGVFEKRKAQFVVMPTDGKYEAKFNRPNSGRCRIVTAWPGDEDSLADKATRTFDC